MSKDPHRVTIKGTFHALIALSSWFLLFYWWKRVLPQITKNDAFAAFLLIGVTIVGTVVTTLVWVRYNIGIFRRKGPRKNLTAVSESYTADALGRKIVLIDPEALRGARSIVITLEGDVKKYQVPKE